jgi:hypothetical protein
MRDKADDRQDFDFVSAHDQVSFIWLGLGADCLRCAESGDLSLSRRRLCHLSWLVSRSKRRCGSVWEERYALPGTWLKCQSSSTGGGEYPAREMRP